MKFENIYFNSDEHLRLALMSLWTPGHHPMRPAIEKLFNDEPLLAEPVFQSTFGWEAVTNDDWRQSLNPVVAQKLGIGTKYPPYKHQAESWKELKSGKSIVVTSGTGSGKTECFMYPVLSDLYEQGDTNAIQAIFLYPLNALMEDQKKRLSEYCVATGLRFAVYNGDTPEFEGKGIDPLPNEVSTREEIRDDQKKGTRPEILLSNPSMLEYILVRKKDQQMLKESSGQLRWIVIDEAHSYSGSAAVELAYQIKRILEAFGEKASDVRFACTSATIGGPDGATELADFISTVIGQPVSQIKVIGGNRLVKPLNPIELSAELDANNLPDLDKVLSLRDKINSVPAMTIREIWDWLRPGEEFKLRPALQLIDKLCELKLNDNPVLSLRGHFFLRAISGLYACANPNCKGVNHGIPLYGHLTSYQGTKCPDCGAPLIELVQCKRCGGFELMGRSSRKTHEVTPLVNEHDRQDYFAIDEDDVDDESLLDLDLSNQEENFYALPYDKSTYFTPLPSEKSEVLTFDLKSADGKTFLADNQEESGKWVELKGDKGTQYCPSCGQLARGRVLNFKHFRIPISFINQTISPVLLQETARPDHSWGKYIAFTDSRQGTAISAKTFNIDVERSYARMAIVNALAQSETKEIPAAILGMPEPYRTQAINAILSTQGGSSALSLKDVVEKIFNEHIFDHIKTSRERAGEGGEDEVAYKAALLRNILGKRIMYDSSMESMGLVRLVYNISDAKLPETLDALAKKNGVELCDKDWHDFLTIILDFFCRAGSHIQALIPGEVRFIRETGYGTPFAEPYDTRKGFSHWPSTKPSSRGLYSRIMLVLCAGLGIDTLDKLNKNEKAIDATLKDAFDYLVQKGIIKRVSGDDTTGYNNPKYYPDEQYVGCYYLDLSGDVNNKVCKVELATKTRVCPVTGQLLTTTFRGYSPLIQGYPSKALFNAYKCNDIEVSMPQRPKAKEDVEAWLENSSEIKFLKEQGFWSNRYQHTYPFTPAYIAAEHSAQQSKDRLREYTKMFSQKNNLINVLHCSTTMEMGVDIGDIDMVLMDTVPPTPANYLQRVGRAGRAGQTKAVALSLCANTPVGQNAFAHPMWALQSTNHMIEVLPSHTIIQRHINSYFFRRFICDNGTGMNTTAGVDDFMSSACEMFIGFLQSIKNSAPEKQKFHKIFGDSEAYTIDETIQSIVALQLKYRETVKELEAAIKLAPK